MISCTTSSFFFFHLVARRFPSSESELYHETSMIAAVATSRMWRSAMPSSIRFKTGAPARSTVQILSLGHRKAWVRQPGFDLMIELISLWCVYHCKMTWRWNDIRAASGFGMILKSPWVSFAPYIMEFRYHSIKPEWDPNYTGGLNYHGLPDTLNIL